jgi:carbon monoxide dehydrogenase subunit G
VALVLAAGASPCLAGRLEVDRCRARGDSVELQLHIDVKAPPRTVWNVLTDYDGQSRFIPGMVQSRHIATTAEGPIVDQVGRVRVLLAVKEISARLQMRETAPHGLEFRALSGTFPKLDGRWRLLPLANGRTRLLYGCRIGARSPLPDAVLGWVVRQELSPRVRAIGREAERRARS